MTEMYWECPVCDWRMTDTEHFYIAIDPLCPGCGIKRLSEFRRVTPEVAA